MTFPENTPTLDDLPNLDLQEIANLPVELLAILQRETDEALKRAKAAKAQLDGALSLRYATRAAEERQAQAKDTGTVRFDDGDFTIVADLPKRVLLRRGAIGQIRRGRLAFVAEMRSLAHVLGQTVGRTFQAGCDAALGDARCGVDLEDPAFKGSGTVIDLLRDRAFTASGLGGFEAGWFAFGTLEWTTGANAGRMAEVLGHDVTEGIAILTLLEPPVRAIAEGDAFTIRAGCDKRIETCSAKFANIANFRGFPHIPGQDTILRYASRDGGHQGGVL